MIKNCEQCGARVERRGAVRFCSDACRQLAYRERKAAQASRAAAPSLLMLPDAADDREALRAVYRAALEVIQRDGLTVPGRRGEAQVAHPLLRFLAPWLSAIEKADDPADADTGTAQLLALASKVTGVPA